jgi:hypothetical protein
VTCNKAVFNEVKATKICQAQFMLRKIQSKGLLFFVSRSGVMTDFSVFPEFLLVAFIIAGVAAAHLAYTRKSMRTIEHDARSDARRCHHRKMRP